MGDEAFGVALGPAAGAVAILGVISNELYCVNPGLQWSTKTRFAEEHARMPNPLH